MSSVTESVIVFGGAILVFGLGMLGMYVLYEGPFSYRKRKP